MRPQQERAFAFACSSGTTDEICLDAFRVRGYAGQFACADRLRSVSDPHPGGVAWQLRLVELDGNEELKRFVERRIWRG